MNQSLGVLIQIMVVSSLIGCSAQVTSSPLTIPTPIEQTCVGKAFTIGDISEDPNEVIVNTLPLANYLAASLADYGYACGEVKVVDTVDKMIELIKNGEVDVYMDSIYPATLVYNATSAQPIARRWRNCDPDYYSVIFSTKDSGIGSIDELPGHMIAMDRSYSTSGFVVPAAYLIDHGIKLAVKESWNAPVAEDEVGVFFSLDDKNTLNLVMEGKVSAGATDDYFYGSWDEQKPGTFIQLAEIGPMPRQALLVSPLIDMELQQAIKQVLLSAHLNPTGLSAMEQSADTCKFDELTDAITVFSQMQVMDSKIIALPGLLESRNQGH